MIRNIVVLSETGLSRMNNQDAVLAVNKGDVGLFAIADGMGGHYRGELASQTAIELLRDWWQHVQNCVSSMPFLDVVTELEKKIKEINKNILRTYEEIGQRGGTTLCLLLVHHNMYAVLNVGDSRLYRCQGWSCTQMTIDDVWENQACVKGTMKMEDIQSSPCYGKLVQALGMQEGLMISVFTGEIRKRISFFLCSDGIYKYCEKCYLESKLRWSVWKKNTVVIMEQIKKMVYKNGANDNLSMILVLTKAEKD